MSGSQPNQTPHPLGADARHFVQPSLQNVQDWETTYGDRNAYRVRGLSWFRTNVQRDIDKLKPFIAKMEEERKLRPAWNTPALAWNDSFALTQVYTARQAKGLKFVKAAKTLLLCEVAAAAKGIPPSVVHSQMRIEPALFGLADFTAELLARACEKSENLLAVLRSGAGQSTEKVFWDMAAGKAVSYRLAWRTRELLLAAKVPGIAWGHVIIVPERRQKPRFEVTGREEIDGASVPHGAPPHFDPTPPLVKP